MNVELFLHGVPYQWDFIGNEEDREYFKLFYDNNISDRLRFLVQIRKLNGKTYCYYNYLVYGNIIGNASRSGSYFGITLRFDYYYKDVLNIYNILNSFFNLYIRGNILSLEKTNFKYIIPNFSDRSDVFKNIENAILGKGMFSEDSFVSLDGLPQSSKTLRYNLYDLSIEDTFSVIKQYGSICLSPYFAPYKLGIVQQECDEKIKKIREQGKQEIDKKNQTIEEFRNNIVKLNSSIKSKDSEIERLEEELRRIKPGPKLGPKPGHKPGPEPGPKPGPEPGHKLRPKQGSKSIKSLIHSLMPYICLLLLLIFIVKQCSVNSEIESQLEGLNSKDIDLSYQIENLGSSNVNSYDSPHIYIQGFDDKDNLSLKKEKTYKVAVINAKEVGNWNVEGADYKAHGYNVITIKPHKKASEVKISYEINGKITTKTIPIEK